MEQISVPELEAAQKSISSTLRKNEKVYETLSQKEKPRTSQLKMVSQNIKNLRIMLTLVERQLIPGSSDAIQMDDLQEVIKAIPSYIGQIERIKPKLKEGSPQLTLAVRRIDAYEMAFKLAQNFIFLV